MRSARSAGWTRSARSRERSSSMRAAGMTPVGPTRPLGVRLAQPLGELREQVVQVVEAALLEERALHPPHHRLDEPFCRGW